MAIIELNVNQEMKEVREILNVSKKTKKKTKRKKRIFPLQINAKSWVRKFTSKFSDVIFPFHQRLYEINTLWWEKIITIKQWESLWTVLLASTLFNENFQVFLNAVRSL